MAKKKNKNKEKIKKAGIYLSIAASILLIGSIFFIFGSRGGNAHNIELEMKTPETVRKGVPMEIEVNINNQTNEPLSNAELTMRLEEGLVNLNFEGDENVSRINLNTIGQGTLTKETVRVLPVGSVGTESKIIATLDYSMGSASFEKSFNKKVKINEEPIEVKIKKPNQILGGSTFETSILYKNTTDFDFPSLSLRVDYPSAFNFISANLNPTSLNNQWKLGALKSGSEGEIKIKGNIENGDSENLNMKATILAEFLDQSYEISKTESDISPSESPLDVDVSVSGSVKAGSTINYNIDYENKSGVALHDVSISSELAGEMFNLNTVKSNGNINRIGNQIVWNDDSTSQLSVLEPGESGAVNFSVRLKEDYPLRRLSDKNFELVVDTKIESPTVPYYVEAEKTSASEKTKTKVNGKTTIDAEAFYRDAGSGFVNDGSLPPTIGERTQFTIHWNIKNFSTDVEDVRIESKLPDGVTWTGKVKSDIDSVPSYNKEKNSIVWNIDKISATRGVISRPINAIFQVELSPQSKFKGSYHPLLLETQLEAVDIFTGRTITYSSGTLNTSLSSDSTTDPSDGVVK